MQITVNGPISKELEYWLLLWLDKRASSLTMDLQTHRLVGFDITENDYFWLMVSLMREADERGSFEGLDDSQPEQIIAP